MNDRQETVIRLAKEKDAEAIHSMILDMARGMGREGRVTSTVEDFRRFGFSGEPCFYALIAERGEKAIGLCLYFFSFSSWNGQRGVYIQDLYVAESQRGTGLGRRLLSETSRLAAQQGASYLRLSVGSTNTLAKQFYTRLGLESSERECIFRAMGSDFEALQNLD